MCYVPVYSRIPDLVGEMHRQKNLAHPLGHGNLCNLYDNVYAIRNETLEAVWPVAARGRYR